MGSQLAVPEPSSSSLPFDKRGLRGAARPLAPPRAPPRPGPAPAGSAPTDRSPSAAAAGLCLANSHRCLVPARGAPGRPTLAAWSLLALGRSGPAASLTQSGLWLDLVRNEAHQGRCGPGMPLDRPAGGLVGRADCPPPEALEPRPPLRAADGQVRPFPDRKHSLWPHGGAQGQLFQSPAS